MAELGRPHLTAPWLRNSALGLWALSFTAFLLVSLYYIVCHHVEPLSRDQWHMYDALFTRGVLDASLGTVSGHRHILAFLLFNIDMQWFGGLNRFLIAFDWLLNGALITLLCTQIWLLPLSRLARTLLCSWVIALLTWLLNIALTGWGFNGINNFMAIVPFMFAIFCMHQAVHHHRSARMLTGCALGVLATLSFANGVLIWISAFICLYLWRAPRCLYYVTGTAAALAAALYAGLPGSDAAQQSLKWPGTAFITFPLQVMGGPVYHLLRSWHLVTDEQYLSILATGAGSIVTAFALYRFIALLRTRPPMLPFQSLCVALMCFGAGSCLMLSMSRLDGFLDFTVDRFQIFAVLVWIGTAGLWITHCQPASVRRWEMLFVIFPLLAFPAQLDWGARLAEYRNRVDMSLLPYQLYLPITQDAERALHWNWENKLPAFFSVLEYTRSAQKNIFHDGMAAQVGKHYTVPHALPACPLHENLAMYINTDQLMPVPDVPAAHPYRTEHPASAVNLARQWRWMIPDTSWNSGLLLDRHNTVRGLAKPVQHSRLPRANGLRHTTFNAHGIMRLDTSGNTAVSLLLLQDGHPVCIAHPSL